MSSYLKFFSKVSFIVILIMSAAVCRADDNAPEPPPQFDKGWNLVSVPCDISLSDFKQNLKEDTLKVYGWNGSAYEEAKALERGRGYFININSVLNPSSVCKPKTANEDMKLTFKPGWNLIGNPYHKPATFTQLLGKTAELEDTGIFELKGDKFIPVKPASQAKPWSGYWLYASTDSSIQIVNIYKLDIRAYKDAARTLGAGNPAEILMGAELYFSATVTSQEGYDKSVSKDVTAGASWGSTDGAAGEFSTGGKFISTAVGSATATAGYDGLVSNAIAVNVVDVKILKLEIRAYKDSARTKESAYPAVVVRGDMLYFSAIVTTQAGSAKSETKDVTAAATWTSSNDAVGALSSSGNFIASDATGTTTVSAEYSGVVSNSVVVKNVDKPPVQCDYLILAMEGQDAYVNYYTSAAFADNTSNEMACFSFAAYGEPMFCSNIHKYGNDMVYEPGNKFSIKAMCAKNKKSYSSQDGIYYSNLTNVSSDVVWKIKDDSIISRNDDGTFMAKAVGIPEISAAYGDKESDKLHFRIMDKKKVLQSIAISANYNNSGDLMSCMYLNNYTGCGGFDYLIGKGKTGQLKAYGSYEVILLSDGKTDIKAVSYNDKYGGGYLNGDDITAKVEWKSSVAGAVTVSSGGLLTAGGGGAATVTASLDGITSNGLKMRVYDGDILYISIEPANEIKVLPGKTAWFKVYAWYMNDVSACSGYSYSYYSYGNCLRSEDITNLAAVSLSNSSIGTAVNGLFTSNGVEGTAVLSAEYKGIKSNAVSVTVKTKIWMVLMINSNDAGRLSNCPDSSCFYTLKGNKIHMIVQGRVEASFWVSDQDVTSMATWEISDTSIATISSSGELEGKSKGIVWIRATVGDARSEKIPVVVVEDNFEFVLAGAGSYGYKPLKPLKVGNSYSFSATYYKYHAAASSNYKCGYSYDSYYGDYYGYYDSASNLECSAVTNNATWNTSDSSIAAFSGNKGVAYGVSPGFVDITASYKGLTSNKSTFEVWNERDMKFCDDNNKNFGVWNDSKAYTKATLETNCKAYTASDTVYIRYTAEVSNTQYLDNCLDLYILDDKDNIVRTLREEGCSTEKLGGANAVKASKPVYQNLEKWDMLDKSGNKVSPGKYYAVARFYILWEPVIRLPFDIVGK